MTKGTCSVTDCERPVCKRGWCQPHYLRNRKFGSPLGGKSPGPLRAQKGSYTPCRVDGCERPKVSPLGACELHLSRWKRHGSWELPQPRVCEYERCSRLESKKSGLCLVHLRHREDPSGSCSFELCDRPWRSSTGALCETHYQQQRMGTPLRRPHRRSPTGSAHVRDELGRKLCIDCEQWHPEAHFITSKKYPDGFEIYCRMCRRNQRLASRYGLSVDQMHSMRVSQGFRCKICRTPEADLSRPLFVDHDHEHCPYNQGCRECVRGLLCHSCNAAIGLLGDSPERLIAAAEYIRAARVRVVEAAA